MQDDDFLRETIKWTITLEPKVRFFPLRRIPYRKGALRLR